MLLVLATGGLRGWIGWQLAGERAALAAARQQGSVASAQRARLEALRSARDAGAAQLSVLRTLRDGSVGDAVWLALDDAHDERIWLDTLHYERSCNPPRRRPPLRRPSCATTSSCADTP